MTQRDFCLKVCPRVTPAGAGEFVFVSVVTVLHDVVNADSAVTIVVVVALPHGAKAVDTEFPVVAEVPSERFKIATVEVAAKRHAFLVGLAVGDNFVAGSIDNNFAVFVLDLRPAVSEVEVQLAVRPERKRVDAVVVLRAADALKHDFVAVSL